MKIQERRKKVERAIANERLEGLNVSTSTRNIFDDYISGKISAKQAAKRVYAQYGVK